MPDCSFTRRGCCVVGQHRATGGNCRSKPSHKAPSFPLRHDGQSLVDPQSFRVRYVAHSRGNFAEKSQGVRRLAKCQAVSVGESPRPATMGKSSAGRTGETGLSERPRLCFAVMSGVCGRFARASAHYRIDHSLPRVLNSTWIQAGGRPQTPAGFTSRYDRYVRQCCRRNPLAL